MKKIMTLVMFFMFSTLLFSQRTAVISVIEAEEYQQRIQKKDVQLVDVRTAKEYEEGHIKGAKNIDFFADNFVEQFKNMDKSRPLYIYCRSGNRSAKASKKLSEAGFNAIIDLEGGYKAWSDHTK